MNPQRIPILRFRILRCVGELLLGETVGSNSLCLSVALSMLALDLLLLFGFRFCSFPQKTHKTPEPVALGGDAGEGTQKQLNLPRKQSPKH